MIQAGQPLEDEAARSGSGPPQEDIGIVIIELQQLTLKLGELVSAALSIGEEITRVLTRLERQGHITPRELKRAHEEVAAQLEQAMPAGRRHRRRMTVVNCR